MTVETKTTIQAGDIKTIEFECAHCHSVSSWPLEIAKAPLTRCHCQPTNNWMAHGGPEFIAIEELITRLRQLSKETNPNYVMRFGLAASIHTPSA